MSDRLRSKHYTRKRLFVSDLRRIFANCRGFNAADTEYYNCAVALEEYVDDLLRDNGLGKG